MLANVICFFYERPVGWIDTPNGPSPSLWHPGAYMVHGTEGYSISTADQNGFMNKDGELAASYILIMGSSHTQGKEVQENSRYSFLLNELLTSNSDSLFVYNIATDGNYLPSLIKHFKAAVDSFPGAKCIVIEIGDTDYSYEELSKAIQQVQLNSQENSRLFEKQSINAKLNMYIKEFFPILSRVKKQYETGKMGSLILDNKGNINEKVSQALMNFCHKRS